jgi:hypothetical protein
VIILEDAIGRGPGTARAPGAAPTAPKAQRPERLPGEIPEVFIHPDAGAATGVINALTGMVRYSGIPVSLHSA